METICLQLVRLKGLLKKTKKILTPHSQRQAPQSWCFVNFIKQFLVLFFKSMYWFEIVFATTILGIYVTKNASTNFLLWFVLKLTKSNFSKNCDPTLLASWRHKGSADAENVVPTWLTKSLKYFPPSRQSPISCVF